MQKEVGDTSLFTGSFERFWDQVFESTGITGYSVQQLLKDAHRWKAERYQHTIDGDAVVVAKPIGWRHGPNAARTELQCLLQLGLTPADGLFTHSNRNAMTTPRISWVEDE